MIWAITHQIDGESIDVETAFLYGDLEEEIYMTVPEGLTYFEDIPEVESMCTKLTATIYGLVQAARQFWKKFVKTLTDPWKLGFRKSKADPCILVKRDKKMGPMLIYTYVDDLAIFGTPEGRAWMKTEIKRYFNIKEEGKLTEYTGVKITETEKGYILRQDEIIDRMEKNFGYSLKDVKSCESPMKPGYSIKRPQKLEDCISPIDQKKYRSGVGSLNYLVKHTRVDLCNCVRELSKVLDGASTQHMKDLYRAMKYVLDTRTLGFPIEPSFIPDDPLNGWIIEAWSDSDWAGDLDNRHSVTGYEIYVNGVLADKKSHLQKIVALSSCEAEYIAMAETASRILYIVNILESLGVVIQYPITLYADNQGAIFLTSNESTSRTKHIDVKHHFLRELVEGPNPVIKVVYVPSQDNRADVYTKNVPVHIFKSAFQRRLKEC